MFVCFQLLPAGHPHGCCWELIQQSPAHIKAITPHSFAGSSAHPYLLQSSNSPNQGQGEGISREWELSSSPWLALVSQNPRMGQVGRDHSGSMVQLPCSSRVMPGHRIVARWLWNISSEVSPAILVGEWQINILT